MPAGSTVLSFKTGAASSSSDKPNRGRPSSQSTESVRQLQNLMEDVHLERSETRKG